MPETIERAKELQRSVEFSDAMLRLNVGDALRSLDDEQDKQAAKIPAP
jgi:hypothetical protein